MPTKDARIDRSFQKENQGTFEQPLMPSSSEGRLSARPFSTARQRSFLRQDEAEAGTRSRRDRLSWNIRKTLCRKNESERVSSDWAIQDERPTAFPSEEGKRRSLMTTPHSYLYLPRASWTPLNDPHHPFPDPLRLITCISHPKPRNPIANPPPLSSLDFTRCIEIHRPPYRAHHPRQAPRLNTSRYPTKTPACGRGKDDLRWREV